MKTESPSTEAVSFKRAFWHLLLISGVFFFNFISRIILAPFLVRIESEFGLTHAMAGGLFFVGALGVSLALILSGFVARKLNHRRTIVVAGIGVGVSLAVVAASTSLNGLRVGLFLLGAASGLYFPSGLATISSILKPQDWGKGFAVHELAPNFSFLLAPLLAVWLGDLLGWRMVFLWLGVGSIAMSFLFLLICKGSAVAGQAPNLRLVKEVAAEPAFWVLAMLFGLAIAANVAPYSMLPVYLVEARGYDQESANQLLSLSRLAGPIMVLLAGVIIDRLGAKRTAIISMAMTGAFTILLGVLHGIPFAGAVLAQPLLSVCYFPAGFTAISQIYRQDRRNLAISLLIPLALLFGAGLVPAGLGWFGDMQRFDMGFLLLGLLLVSGAFLTRRVRF